MNPEEGELRPQLADRSGCTSRSSRCPPRRARGEVLRRREAFTARSRGVRGRLGGRSGRAAPPARGRRAPARRHARAGGLIRRDRLARDPARRGEPPRRHSSARMREGACGTRRRATSSRPSDLRAAADLALGHRVAGDPFSPDAVLTRPQRSTTRWRRRSRPGECREKGRRGGEAPSAALAGGALTASHRPIAAMVSVDPRAVLGERRRRDARRTRAPRTARAFAGQPAGGASYARHRLAREAGAEIALDATRAGRGRPRRTGQADRGRAAGPAPQGAPAPRPAGGGVRGRQQLLARRRVDARARQGDGARAARGRGRTAAIGSRSWPSAAACRRRRWRCR